MPIVNSVNHTVITPENSTGTARTVTRFHGLITQADFNTAGNGLVHESDDGSYRCTQSLYFDSDCNMEDISGLRLNIARFFIYVHPDAPNTIFNSITIIMPPESCK